MKNQRSYLKKIIQIKADLKKIPDLDWTDHEISRICIAGNPSGTAFHHWRWKTTYLPDIVAWPTNEDQIVQILQLANNYCIPITPRGGGTCYFGGSVPAIGGIVIDLKRFNGLKINSESKEISVESGAVFSNVEKELGKYNLSLGSYPSSFLGATIGGWLASGGTIGIGTFKNGPLSNQITGIKYITPTCQIKFETEAANWQHLIGTNGIFGIITEVILNVFPKIQLISELYQLNDFDKLQAIISDFAFDQSIRYIRFSDYAVDNKINGKTNENSLSVQQNQTNSEYFLYILREINSSKNSGEKLNEVIKNSNGSLLYSSEKLDVKEFMNEITNFEIAKKKITPILLVQHLLTTKKNVKLIINIFRELADRYQIKTNYYGQMNSDGSIRLICLCLADNSDWVHFLAAKAILHEIMKKNYSLAGKAYSYGLLNTFYLLRFEKDAKMRFRTRKMQEDPFEILNPNKIIRSKITLSRINIMFHFALLFRQKELKKRGN